MEVHETLCVMVKREKLSLPDSFLAAINAERQRLDISWNELALRAGVTGPSMTRMKNNKASWDTIAKVARCLGVAPPLVVDPDSPAGRLERLRTEKPAEYEIVRRLLPDPPEREGDVTSPHPRVKQKIERRPSRGDD